MSERLEAKPVSGHIVPRALVREDLRVRLRPVDACSPLQVRYLKRLREHVVAVMLEGRVDQVPAVTVDILRTLIRRHFLEHMSDPASIRIHCDFLHAVVFIAGSARAESTLLAHSGFRTGQVERAFSSLFPGAQAGLARSLREVREHQGEMPQIGRADR
jgi:hypothetical protein